MKVNLVFRTKQNLIVTREIDIDPGLKDTVGVYENGVDYLFQLECVGLQWFPGSLDVIAIEKSEFESCMDQMIDYGLNHDLIAMDKTPKKPKSKD